MKQEYVYIHLLTSFEYSVTPQRSYAMTLLHIDLIARDPRVSGRSFLLRKYSFSCHLFCVRIFSSPCISYRQQKSEMNDYYYVVYLTKTSLRKIYYTIRGVPDGTVTL